MVDRQDLRRRASDIRDSVAGTLGEARDRAVEVVRSGGEEISDNLGPDRGTRDQLEARVERARVEAQQSAAQQAREEFLSDVRDDVREARTQLLKAEFEQEAAPNLAQLERRADAARLEAARVEGQRAAFDEIRDQRIETATARAKQNTLDRLEPQQPEPEPEPRDAPPAAPMGGIFGGAIFGGGQPAPEQQSAEQDPPQEPAPPAPVGGIFGGPVLGPPPESDPDPEPADPAPAAPMGGVFGGPLAPPPEPEPEAERQARGGAGMFGLDERFF